MNVVKAEQVGCVKGNGSVANLQQVLAKGVRNTNIAELDEGAVTIPKGVCTVVVAVLQGGQTRHGSLVGVLGSPWDFTRKEGLGDCSVAYQRLVQRGIIETFPLDIMPLYL